MKLKLALASILAAGACLSNVNAVIVSTWDFDTISGNNPSALSTTPAATGNYLANTIDGSYVNGPATLLRWSDGGSGATISGSTPGGLFSGESIRFVAGKGSQTQLNSCYFQLEVRANQALNGFSLTYSAQIGGNTATASQPRFNNWSYSTDGSNFTPLAGQQKTITSTYSSYTVDFASASVSAGGTIYFRNQLSGGVDEGGKNFNVDFDNISITAVPEPVNAALGCFGLGAIGIAAGRRLLHRRAQA